MKKVLYWLTIAALLSVLGPAARSQCDAPAILAPTPYNNWSVLSDKEKFSNLLIMLGSTSSPVVSCEATYWTKGNLNSGINLPDAEGKPAENRSLVFEV